MSSTIHLLLGLFVILLGKMLLYPLASHQIYLILRTYCKIEKGPDCADGSFSINISDVFGNKIWITKKELVFIQRPADKKLRKRGLAVVTGFLCKFTAYPWPLYEIFFKVALKIYKEDTGRNLFENSENVTKFVAIQSQSPRN